MTWSTVEGGAKTIRGSKTPTSGSSPFYYSQTEGAMPDILMTIDIRSEGFKSLISHSNIIPAKTIVKIIRVMISVLSRDCGFVPQV